MATVVSRAFSKSSEDVLNELVSSRTGLSFSEADSRLLRDGPNALPRARLPGMFFIFISQFASPLIYVLVAAALLSISIREYSDAGFITAVLMINAIIGTIQEFSAQRSATALQKLVTTLSRVLRDEDTYEINSEELVVGDVVLLESGDRIPADLRLLTSHDLHIDESLLTGESISVAKFADQVLDEDTFLGERTNMAYAGSMVERGRGMGVVTATGLDSELGHIAADVLTRKPAKAPLMIRMEYFTRMVALLVGVAALIMAAVSINRGMPFEEIFLLAVALAVSAIPEGLPVAITVALAIGMRRMASRSVIIRRLVAVESLGSCTFIATDKTGTLTVNQMTARVIGIPDDRFWEVSGEGDIPDGEISTPEGPPNEDESRLLEWIANASVLSNDAFLGHRDHGWTHHGDAVDVALLVMAHKAGIRKPEAISVYPEISSIPFESEQLFSASLNQLGGQQVAFVKGAVEKLLPMCSTMAMPGHDVLIDPSVLESQAHQLASSGYRVLALASGTIDLKPGEVFSEEHLYGLTFLGIVGLIDPLRPESMAAVAACRRAGIEVGMITGDHPSTALAIARNLDLADQQEHIVTGPQLKQTTDQSEYDALTSRARVFARVEPRQKLDIVQSLQRNGHFVAVSGDGANDAPALSAAQIGVAMGKSGTDVARETAGLIITDDNFSSIVAGVEEGRIAYANVRKVIFLLISTGVAELVLFTLALVTNQPLPLVAVQLLWLNLVTNGIQDVALAFEPGEGNELECPPRPPKEPIFNRIMIERVVISALVMGIVAFFLFQSFLTNGYSIDESRNATLLLMVLFENIHVFNSRSETRSALFHNPLRNKILLFGTLIAQIVHIGAMYTPWISDVLRIQPVTFDQWLELLFLALTVMLAMELHKFLHRLFRSGKCLSDKLD